MVPSERFRCATCNGEVWVDRNLVDYARSCDAVMCVQCAVERVDPGS